MNHDGLNDMLLHMSRLRNATAGKRLSAAELTAVLQQIYIKERDGSKTLLAPYRNRLAKVNICRKFIVLST